MMVVESYEKIENREDVCSKYFYRLVKGSITLTGESGIEFQTYGIEIERQDNVNGKIICIDRECVANISPQRYKVHNLLKLFLENTVSPVHLVDILEEYIDKYIIDFDDNFEEKAAMS